MYRKILVAVIATLTIGSLYLTTVCEARRGHHRSHGRYAYSHGYHTHGHYHDDTTFASILDTLDLTDEHRTTIDMTLAALVVSGGTKSEMRVAINEHLTEFGIEIPLALKSS